MKVLFVVTSFPSTQHPTGGIFNLRAAHQLSKQHEITVIHLRTWLPKRPFHTTSEFESLKVHTLFLPIFDQFSPAITAFLLVLYKSVSFRMLNKLIKEHDVIHSVGASLSGIVAAHWSKKTDLPHIAQCIGTDMNIDVPKIKNMPGVLGWAKGVKFFVCNSIELSKIVKNMYPGVNTEVIYRGTDLTYFCPVSKENYNGGPLYFLFAGGFSDRGKDAYGRNLKGGEDVLSAIEILSKDFPANTFIVLFGGPDCEDIRKADNFSKIAAYLSIIGLIPKDSMPEYMNKANIVLVPSMLEGLPNVAVEASACARPVIGTRVGGIPEVIEDGKTGFIVPPAKPDELANTMRHFLLNPYMVNAMGEKARQRAIAVFDKDQFANKYTHLYQEIIK